MGLVDCDLAKCIADTIAAQSPRHLEVGNDTAQRYAVSIRPYLNVDGQADGVVLTLADVTPLRRAESALALAVQQILALEHAAFTSRARN
jgi:hypothetical protein